jgi:hypothetical protein
LCFGVPKPYGFEHAKRRFAPFVHEQVFRRLTQWFAAKIAVQKQWKTMFTAGSAVQSLQVMTS